MKRGRRVRPIAAGSRGRNLKLVLEYDGSGYFGFQRQPHHLTIQQVLEEALTRILQEPVTIAAASGRTDTGVSACGQVVNFRSHTRMSTGDLLRALNGVLPKDTAVTGVRDVGAGFHARYSCVSKTYEYRIWNRPVRSPFEGKYAWHVARPLNLPAMRRAAAILSGKHDFRAFCASGSKALSDPERGTVRHVRKISISQTGRLIRIRVTADGFLYRMVRNITGAVVACGLGKMSARDLKRVLLSRDRRQAPATAPAAGLRLIKVSYS